MTNNQDQTRYTTVNAPDVQAIPNLEIPFVGNQITGRMPKNSVTGCRFSPKTDLLSVIRFRNLKQEWGNADNPVSEYLQTHHHSQSNDSKPYCHGSHVH